MVLFFKVRQNGKAINKTIYLAVGLNSEGFKEMLGMWLGESESAFVLDECIDRFAFAWRGRYPDHQHQITQRALRKPLPASLAV